MPRSGSKRKKTRTHVTPDEREEKKIPRTFVVKHGHCGRAVGSLVRDMRQVMLPHTAASLKESRKGKIKDYLALAGPLGVSHLLMFQQTSDGNASLRVGCFPRGPTCHYSLQEYSLMRGVRATQRKPVSTEGLFKGPPLVVINGFDTNQPHQKLATLTWQALFPSIDVSTVKLAACRRVVLLDRDASTDTVRFRHFAVTVKPAGLSRNVRKLAAEAQIPNMRGARDISELLLGGGGGAGGSDSEYEDETCQVRLTGNVGRTADGSQSIVRLVELGPRMRLKLVKIEQELCKGEVMYHAYQSKTAEEKAEMRSRAELKRKRREEQEANVQRKKEAAEALRAEKEARREAKRQKVEAASQSTGPAPTEAPAEGAADEAGAEADEEEVWG
jgi:ribosome biogenesis protein SSF1/2